MKSITFLVSGGGGNLKFFCLAMRLEIISDVKITVISDRECPALDFAKKNGFEAHLVDYKRANPKQLVQILENINPDIIVTNWHKIIDSETVKKFSGKMINLHYSLLPAFPGVIGVEPIKKAYEQGCKFIGATCHYVDEGVDTGEILAQSIFTTNRLLEDSISLMFRKGCLTLMAGVQLILENRKFNFSTSVVDDSVSPETYLDERFFNDEFWVKVSKL
jgi:phosphoribosylglycinamide formyltransferase-1